MDNSKPILQESGSEPQPEPQPDLEPESRLEPLSEQQTEFSHSMNQNGLPMSTIGSSEHSSG